MKRRDFLTRLSALLAAPALLRQLVRSNEATSMLAGYEEAELTAARSLASYSALGYPNLHTHIRLAGFEAAEIPTVECWAYRIEPAEAQ